MNGEELETLYQRHKAKRMTGSMTRATPSVSPLPLSREPRPDAGHFIPELFVRGVGMSAIGLYSITSAYPSVAKPGHQQSSTITITNR